MSRRGHAEQLLALALLGMVSLMLMLAGRAGALGLADDANAEWQVEQPAPPPPEAAGVEPSSTPISLGHIGDIEFWEANRGALITAGNGSSIKPGVWFYNGTHWHELSNKCGATDGRIAWAGPDEFWTVSDGRPGQAIVTGGERPPLEDDTLCHFAPGGPASQVQIVASYASPPFLASSYLAMHAAACIGPNDCWFGGDPLKEPQTGAFQLHWNGHSLEAAPFLPEGRPAEGHAAWDMVPFEGSLVESVRLLLSDRSVKPVPHPPVLHRINPEGSPRVFETVEGLPPVLYYEGEFPTALDYLHLSSADETLWAAAGPQIEPTPGSEPAGVTVARKQAGAQWSQVIGPKSGQNLFGASAVLDSTGAEPGSSSTWVALDSRQDVISPNPLARARIARVNADGSISDEAELPATEDPHGPLGAAQQIVCPAPHDCWLSTTDGWLAHLATAEERAHPNPESDPVFAGEELLDVPPARRRSAAGTIRRTPRRHLGDRRRKAPGRSDQTTQGRTGEGSSSAAHARAIARYPPHHARAQLPPGGEGQGAAAGRTTSPRRGEDAVTHAEGGQPKPPAQARPQALADQAQPADARACAPADSDGGGSQRELRIYLVRGEWTSAERCGTLPVSRRSVHVRRRRSALGAVALAGLVLALAIGLPAGSVPRASGLAGVGEMVAQTDDSIPATRVTMFGSSPLEAPDEAWGVGQRGGGSVLVRYLPESAGQEGGWSLGSPFLDSTGTPLTGFAMDQPEAYREPTPSPLAGQMTSRGSGALGGTVGSGSSARQVLLVRKPGGAFQETTPVPSGEEGLAEGERLFGVNRAPMIAALDEEGGGAGALVAPVSDHGLDTGVLHWDGSSWTREPIEIPTRSSEQFEVVALGASSPGNAWLLARLSPEYKAGSLALFRRHLGSGTPTWQPVAPKAGGEPGEPIDVDNEVFTVPNADQAQVMTVTPTGLWLDGLRRDVQASTTLFFRPEGESNAGQVAQAWCKLPANAPAGTPGCEGELPEALPRDFSRSFAWSGTGSFGERVITGLRDGQSLRLTGNTFTTVLSLGGEAGAGFGAAFASAQEGWLGKELLPVHLTQNGVSSKLAPWPVPFRFALTALAPQPGVPVGALSSQVLAVGDRGEVARYHPGQGWFPETLPASRSGERATPRLRAVAWPTAKSILRGRR